VSNKILIAARIWSVIWAALVIVALTHQNVPDPFGALICASIAGAPWALIWAIRGRLR
jgi:hypothetical protein